MRLDSRQKQWRHRKAGSTQLKLDKIQPGSLPFHKWPFSLQTMNQWDFVDQVRFPNFESLRAFRGLPQAACQPCFRIVSSSFSNLIALARQTINSRQQSYLRPLPSCDQFPPNIIDLLGQFEHPHLLPNLMIKRTHCNIPPNPISSQSKIVQIGYFRVRNLS